MLIIINYQEYIIYYIGIAIHMSRDPITPISKIQNITVLMYWIFIIWHRVVPGPLQWPQRNI